MNKQLEEIRRHLFSIIYIQKEILECISELEQQLENNSKYSLELITEETE